MSTTQNTVPQGDEQPCTMGIEATGHDRDTGNRAVGKEEKQLTMTVKHPTLPPRLEGEPWPARDTRCRLGDWQGRTDVRDQCSDESPSFLQRIARDRVDGSCAQRAHRSINRLHSTFRMLHQAGSVPCHAVCQSSCSTRVERCCHLSLRRCDRWTPRHSCVRSWFELVRRGALADTSLSMEMDALVSA
jgi:hypothetical protein